MATGEGRVALFLEFVWLCAMGPFITDKFFLEKLVESRFIGYRGVCKDRFRVPKQKSYQCQFFPGQRRYLDM